MSILASEVKFKRSSSVSNIASNGGRMGSTEISNAVANNIFPDVSQAERAAGALHYRKVYVHDTNAAGLAMQNPKLFLENYTAASDAVTMFPGTQSDTQSDLIGTERQYGSGKLNADVLSGVDEITVLVEAAALNYLRDGDTIRISDKVNIDAAGNEEYAVIDGVPSYAGDVATVTLAAPLLNAYDADLTRVASVIEPANIEIDVEGVVVTSAAGTFNDVAQPITGSNRGTVEQNWTLTFTGAAAFTVSGDTVGSVGAGGTGANFAPNNPATGTPYFTIPTAGWGGVFVTGDTVLFETHPAAYPVWFKRTVPAGAAAAPNNQFVLGVDFESA